MAKNEIVLFTSNDLPNFHIEVRLENDTVWLNRQQLSLLFGRDVKTIGKHITNVLNEELNDMSFSVVAKFAITAKDGKVYQVEHYNLDVIISVGYRVKSKRGIQFRIWANKVLKDFLLKGYAVNNRLDRIDGDISLLKDKVDKIDFQVQSSLPQTQGIFFDGQIFDAYVFVSKLIKSATKSIILIDNYIDESTLLLLAKRNKSVKTIIFTEKITRQLKLDIEKYITQYPEIIVKTYKKYHDRFLIIDNKTVYHIGASLKDLGKKWFAFSRLDIKTFEILYRLKLG